MSIEINDNRVIEDGRKERDMSIGINEDGVNEDGDCNDPDF